MARVHLRDVGGGRRQARADRPDRLVGDDEPLRRRALGGSEPRNCALTTAHRLAGLALGAGFADADDGGQARPQRRLRLGRTTASVSPWPARRSEWPTMT